MNADIQILSTPRKEFLISQLCFYRNRLQSFLTVVENENIDYEYAKTCLKEVEVGLKNIRKEWVAN